MTVTRYHPVLVALHWLLALMIGFQLAFGYFVIGRMSNVDPNKLGPLAKHMGFGTALLALLVIRLLVHFFTHHPPATAHQQRGIGRLRRPMHWLLYAAAFVTAGSGWFTGFLIAHLYETPGNTLPADFATYPSRMIHVFMAPVLLLLIVLHVAAAVRERSFGNKDIMSRMWFGKRQA